MKKFLAILAVLTLLVPALALGEPQVQLLSSPDMAEPEYEGSLDNLVLGQGIDLGDRVYLPLDGGFTDSIVTDDYGARYKSGNDAELVFLTVQITNMATQPQTFFKGAEVTLTYSNSRGDYVYGGDFRQGNQQSKFFWAANKIFAVTPLYNTYYCFYAAVPNFVRDTAGRIVLTVKVGEEVMTYVVRAE